LNDVIADMKPDRRWR